MRKRRESRCSKARPALPLLLCAAALAAGQARAAAPVDRPQSAPLPAAGSERTMLLEVHINGQSTGKLENFVERGGMLYATRADLEDFGLILDPQAPQTPDGMVALAALTVKAGEKGAPYRLDERSQALYFTLGRESLKPTVLSANPIPLKASTSLDTGRGAVLNYDAVVTSAQGSRAVASALLDARVFGPFGNFSTGAIVQSGAGMGMENVVRLDSTFTHTDTQTLRRTTAGDFISRGLSWTRPVRLFGLQFGTDFSLRPDLITTPMPRLSGETAVPSTVDVLVNGVRQITQNVNPGPFEVRQVPVPTGVGEVALTVQDALGRTSVQRLPFYGSSRLLAAGQSSWTIETGLVRRNYGLRSWDYGKFAAAGTARYGLSDTLTLEAHSELAARGSNVGAGVYYSMGNWGMVSGALSANVDGRGVQTTLAYERVSSQLSVALSLTEAQADRRDIASVNGDAVPRFIGRASASLPMGKLGTVSTAVAQTRAGVGVGSDAQMAVPALGGNTTLYTVSYTRSITERMQLFLNAYTAQRNDSTNGTSHGFFAAISFTLEPNISGGLSANNGGSGTTYTAQAMRPAQNTGDLGWQTQIAEGQYRRVQAEAEYRMPWAHANAGVDQLNGRTAVRAGLRGAVATVDSALSISGPIQNSFAIVDTDGRAGVPVLYENRPIGVTDSRGLLTLPNLRPYDANRIAIDPLSVDADIEFRDSAKQVRPQERSGTRVKFAIQRVSAALVTLVDANGVWIPLGSVVEQSGSHSQTPVGHEGQAYLSELGDQNNLRVRMPNGKICHAVFPYLRQEGDHTRAFHVVCSEAS